MPTIDPKDVKISFGDLGIDDWGLMKKFEPTSFTADRIVDGEADDKAKVVDPLAFTWNSDLEPIVPNRIAEAIREIMDKINVSREMLIMSTDKYSALIEKFKADASGKLPEMKFMLGGARVVSSPFMSDDVSYSFPEMDDGKLTICFTTYHDYQRAIIRELWKNWRRIKRERNKRARAERWAYLVAKRLAPRRKR